MAEPGPMVTDYIMAVSGFVTAGAVVFQALMWKEQKRQNDLQSRPRLRLRPHAGPPVSKRTELHNIRQSDIKVLQATRHELFCTDVEEEWRSHIQAVPGNLTAVPDVEVGFLVENIGGVLATGLRLKLELEVFGNPNDKNVHPKAYRYEHNLEIDVPAGASVFLPILHCRLIFETKITGRILMVRDPLGIAEAYKEKQQADQVLSFTNEPLLNALSAAAAQVEELPERS